MSPKRESANAEGCGASRLRRPHPARQDSTWPPRRGAGQLRVPAGAGRGRHQRNQYAGAAARGPGWRNYGSGPAWEVETGGRWGSGASLGASEFWGEGSCQTEAEGNEAEAAEKRGAPPLHQSGLPVPPLPLQPPALPCLPALGRAGPRWPPRE